MKLHELKAEVANLVGIPDDLPCDQTANALEYLLSDLRRAPREAWEQVEKLNDQINELHREVMAAKSNANHQASERQRLEDRLLKISARFEVIYEIIDNIDDLR